MNLCSEEYGVLIQNSKQILMNPKKILKNNLNLKFFVSNLIPKDLEPRRTQDLMAPPLPVLAACLQAQSALRLKVLGGQI